MVQNFFLFYLFSNFVFRLYSTFYSIHQQGIRQGLGQDFGGLFYGFFISGPLQDVVIFAIIFSPFILISLILKYFFKKHEFKKSNHILGFFFISTTLLMLNSEILFWNEFQSRLNFIAVDYIVYTNELLKNAWESYPMPAIIIIICAITIGILRSLNIFGGKFSEKYNFLLLPIAILGLFFWPKLDAAAEKPQGYLSKEIGKNGFYSLFDAYRNNELEYSKFYLTKPNKEVFERLSKNILGHVRAYTEGSEEQSIYRKTGPSQSNPAKKLNVVLVAMESMSARFLGVYGNKESLTPNLDSLANHGLFFDKIYSTGTRTVRGLEALILSIPPTPGQSVVRRPQNQDLYSLPKHLNHLGYISQFLYGGYAYFDNMKAFFEGNHVEVLDQPTIPKDKITFTNAWGTADEDIFNHSIRSADEQFQKNKLFFQVILTASNHRPYTYPQKIDIPSGSGRSGAVKYSDFSIGEYIKTAKTKPWFDDTLFIFVADHNASVAGGTSIPIYDFLIPVIFYSPKHISTQRISSLGSQIDIAPTILSILGVHYESHFFGHDLLSKEKKERAFLATYQKVGLLKDGEFVVLAPLQKIERFKVNPVDSLTRAVASSSIEDDAISYYQSASLLYKSGKMKRITGNDKTWW